MKAALQNDKILDSQLTLTQLAELVNEKFAAMSATERVAWLAAEFPGEVLLSSSFGLQAAVMLRLVSQNSPEVPVIFIDTGYHFPETYRYVEELREQLGFDLQVINPKITAARQEALWGKLWEQGDEGHKRYHLMNKIEPMDRALKEHGARIWLSGLRRSQSKTRKDRPFAEAQNGTLKVYPILDWDDAEVKAYFEAQQLPQHPLEAMGYTTMGDWHSTRPAEASGEREGTRFDGEKYECGLHLDSGVTDFQI